MADENTNVTTPEENTDPTTTTEETDPSKIELYLQTIETAVYGEDMRQAIHDAIKECYKDGDRASIDMTARDDIELLSARFDVFVAGLNVESSSTSAMEYDSCCTADTNNTPTAMRIGSVVQLSGRVRLTKAVKLTDWGTYQLLFTVPEGYRPDTDHIYTVQKFDDSYGIQIQANGRVRLNRFGNSEKYPVTVPKDTVLNVTIVYLCTEAVGSESPSEWAEIEDARIARDGTVYNSLGAAIRAISVGGASDYEALSLRVDQLELDKSTINSQITSLQSADTSLGNRITTLEQANTTKTSQITALQNADTSLGNRITAAENSLSNLAYSLAANSEIDSLLEEEAT